MIFEIKTGFNKYGEVDKSHFRDLTPDEKKGATFNLSDYFSFISSYRHNKLNYTEFDNNSLSNKFVQCIKDYSDNAKNIIRLILKESVEPRSTKDTTDWGDNVIKAIPFIISETLEDLKKSIISLHFENMIVQNFDFVTSQAKKESQNTVNETNNFLASFLPMFKHIHPTITFEYNTEAIENEAKENFKNIQDKKLKLSYESLHQVMSHLHEHDMEMAERGMRAEPIFYTSTPDNDTMQILYELIGIKAYQLNRVLSIFIATMTHDFFRNRNNQIFFSKFKNFDSYNNHSRQQTLENCSRRLYDVKEKTIKEMKEFELDTDNRKKRYDHKTKYDKINALKFTLKFNEWIHQFNQIFNAEKTNIKTFNIIGISDCHVITVNESNLVAIPLVNSDNGYVEQFRGAIMNKEQLEKAMQVDMNLSETLLKNWDILGVNENNIPSTSFHNLNHVIDELNDKKIVKFFFKDKPVDEEWVFLG